jgi:protein ImuA
MLQVVKIDRVEALKPQVARLEQGGRGEAAPVLPFGLPAIDRRLPGGGLALGALHEVGGLGPDAEDGAVPAGFIAGLCARLDPLKPVLWCQAAGDSDLYGPGLATCGLAPERLILARPRSATDLLWAMEEGLRTRSLAAVVGELEDLPAPASRRLQLAAETSGVTGFALRRVRTAPLPDKNKNYQTNPIVFENKGKFSSAQPIVAPNAAVTRWTVSSLPSAVPPGEPGIGRKRWRLELWRARGAAPAEWIVEACDATGHVALPAALGDGAARREQRRASA